MKKVKLPRKRKKIFKKDCRYDADIEYMAARIINELALEDPAEFNPVINNRRFIKHVESYHNGLTKKVISYY